LKEKAIRRLKAGRGAALVPAFSLKESFPEILAVLRFVFLVLAAI